ncbi:hypothetical protein [Xanthomonas sp. 3075]|uniref:hypothetical protein n=1 Tax=Xanthomonas sp. 3075 TaxID=3035315 RepID=UPI00161C967E|nr:hypothetical protein [Xanthomonas sp. 3075]MBB4131486.1 hypothetical protein [Xanthomonas sp. 3075]
MFRRFCLAALACLAAIDVVAAAPSSNFCAAIKALPLQDYRKTAALLHNVETVRTSEKSAGDGRSVEDIQAAIAPYALSPELKQVFIDQSDSVENDYSVYRSTGDALFQFTDVQGSMKCANDVWAVRKGTQLELLSDGPDLGEGCDVVRLYGTFGKVPVLVQYLYQSAGSGSGAAHVEKVEEIRVVALEPDQLHNVCVIR